MTRGNQREIDRQRAAARNAGKGASKEGDHTKRNENDASALAAKVAAKKGARRGHRTWRIGRYRTKERARRRGEEERRKQKIICASRCDFVQLLVYTKPKDSPIKSKFRPRIYIVKAISMKIIMHSKITKKHRPFN
mmetsp:Transcript_9477/g.15716  ORF Transcript_9477/g.15716 Transcript_9477/m.15716 type:complete len:136 (-) Transcript_9477:1798-2205(-)